MDMVALETLVWLREALGTAIQTEKHAFSHQDEVYTVRTPRDVYYLKIADSLKVEHDNLRRTQPYLLVPAVIDLQNFQGRDHLLMSAVPGKNLAELVRKWDVKDIIEEFAQAVREFHALDASKLFPKEARPGLVVLHGDMAMPNIICTRPGSRGYIDLAQMRVGTPDEDLADAIWSLQRNVGPGHGELFLAEYGNVTMTEKLQKALAFRYRP